MQAYRVLLVDDEEEIRTGISRRINWEALGFVLVGQAENGAEALELAEQLRPDVVLTDIKMPFMDGLELCRRLKTLLPAAKLVIFSGFDDFEYARQAIGINVSEYILKPIGAAELSELLQRLKTQLDSQRAAQRDIEALRRRYEESLPVLRELFFTRLLDGRLQPEQVEQRAANYDVPLPGGLWAVALVQPDASAAPGGQSELLLFSVRAFVSEQFSLRGATVRPILYNDTVALAASLGPGGIYPFAEELDRLCSLSRSYLGLSLDIGLGRPCPGAASLSQSAAQAASALEYRVLVGHGRVIYIGDMEKEASQLLAFSEADERALSTAIKLGEEPEVRQIISQLMQRVRHAGLALQQCHFYFFEMMAGLIRLARAAEVSLEDVFGDGFAGTVQLTDFASLDELEAWYTECCLRLRAALNRQRSDSAWSTIEKAKEYIQANYADSELGVETLCARLHLSPAYFSTLFKRHTELGFAAYVTSVRIEAAKRLLQTSDEKTYLIAAQVGYADPNYFSYVFKRQVGVSPSQFRAAGQLPSG